MINRNVSICRSANTNETQTAARSRNEAKQRLTEHTREVYVMWQFIVTKVLNQQKSSKTCGSIVLYIKTVIPTRPHPTTKAIGHIATNACS